MSITSRISSMEEHVTNAYNGLQGLGADLTGIDKNIENISMVLDDIYDSMPQVSGEGTNLTLDDTRVGKIKSTLKGNTSQTTYSGKNLLPEDKYDTTRTLNGITYTNNGNGTISVSGTTTKDTTINFLPANNFNLEANQSYYFYSSQPYNANTFNLSIITIENGSVKYLTANNTRTMEVAPTSTRVALWIPNGTTVNAQNVKLMLVKGTTAPTEYEPYVGGTASPNPSYPQPVNVVSGDNEIVVCGKNLFDKSTAFLNKMVTGSGGLIDFTGAFSSDYIKVQPSTDYYVNQYMPTVVAFDKDKNAIGYIRNASGSATFTTPNNCEYIRARMFDASIDMTTALNNAMLNLGTSATTYEPYIGNNYNIDLPVENLFNKNGNLMLDYRLANDGGDYRDIGYYISEYIPINANTTYTKNSPTADYAHRVCFFSNNNTTSFISKSENNTFTTPSNAKYLRFCGLQTEIDTTQLEVGSKQNAFTPYGTTPIELCSSQDGTKRDYLLHDKTIDKWYWHREIGERIFNGTESWSYNSSGSYFVIYNPISDIDNKEQYSSQTLLPQLISNYYTPQTWQNFNNGAIGFAMFFANNTLQMRLSSSLTSVDAFKSWLGTNQPIFKYILATPTNTEITYQPLIDQLNLLEKAMSKDGQTNISQVNNDLPFIISASALKEWQESTSLNSTLSMANPLSLGNTLNTQDNNTQPIEVDNIEPLEEEENEES